MACSHRNSAPVASGVWANNDKKSFVKEAIVNVYLCESCSAIRIDALNCFVYAKGKWSRGNKTRPASVRGKSGEGQGKKNIFHRVSQKKQS